MNLWWLRILFVSTMLTATTAAAEDDPDLSVKTSFESILVWLQSNAPELVDEFNPPAAEPELAAFENRTGLMLPRTVRAAYAIHNGEKNTSQGIFGGWRWLPLDEVSTIRHNPTAYGIELAEAMIPVLVSGGGDYFYVEAASTPSEISEVIEWWHEDPVRDVKHVSFAAMLKAFFNDLESGQYVYLPNEFVGLIDQDDL